VSLTVAAEEANVIGSAIRPPRPAGAPPLNGPRFEVQGLKERMVAELRPAPQRAPRGGRLRLADRVRERRQSVARARHSETA